MKQDVRKDKEAIMDVKLPVMAVLDTDTCNEIVDQFAPAYALLSRETVDPQAVTAAPFSNDRAATPGMLTDCREMKNHVFRASALR